jgi:hypothetical protein
MGRCGEEEKVCPFKEEMGKAKRPTLFLPAVFTTWVILHIRWIACWTDGLRPRGAAVWDDRLGWCKRCGGVDMFWIRKKLGRRSGRYWRLSGHVCR